MYTYMYGVEIYGVQIYFCMYMYINVYTVYTIGKFGRLDGRATTRSNTLIHTYTSVHTFVIMVYKYT